MMLNEGFRNKRIIYAHVNVCYMYKPKQKKKQWKLEKIEIHVVTNVLEVLYVEMLISFQFDNNKRFGVCHIYG